MKHIVIAEDEPKVRDFFARATRRLAPDALVTAVGSGAEALAIARTGVCDLVITDHRMPGMTGLDLLRALRRELPDLPVVIISADAAAEQLALLAGANAFFHKPVTLGQFREIVGYASKG